MSADGVETIIETIIEQKGFLPACAACPLQLTCAGGRYPEALRCSRCQNIYIASLNTRIDCDVLRMGHITVLPTGLCCGGHGVVLLQGVSLSDRIPKR